MQTSTAFISRVHNKIEVSCHQPGLNVQITNVLQLSKEGPLIHIPLGTIDSREPPALIHPNGNTRRDRIRGEVG
jgi:hypothetical protein